MLLPGLFAGGVKKTFDAKYLRAGDKVRVFSSGRFGCVIKTAYRECLVTLDGEHEPVWVPTLYLDGVY